MTKIFDGVRILEVANWTFVPQAGAVIGDLGADVIKVEHPVRGDPQRALVSSGMSGAAVRNVNYHTEQTNHGKRSIGLDISTERGREVLLQLATRSDVFLTNFLPRARQKLRIDVEDLRAANPDIIYVRGSGFGPKGADADRPGYDSSSFWARGGVGWVHTAEQATEPVAQRGAFGDRAGAMNLAFGISAALYHRERTGEPSIVDVSLLATAMWLLSSDLNTSAIVGHDPDRTRGRAQAFNPITNMYRCQDNRWISLVMLESDRFWPDLCRHLDRPDLIADPRFCDSTARATNAEQCIAELDAVFRQHPLSSWIERLASLSGSWAVQQSPLEVLADPQVAANGYVAGLIADDGDPFTLIPPPVQFDETTPTLARAPEMGGNTEELLLEIGYSWDEVSALKQEHVVN